jgi:hypothetical protein
VSRVGKGHYNRLNQLQQSMRTSQCTACWHLYLPSWPLYKFMQGHPPRYDNSMSLLVTLYVGWQDMEGGGRLLGAAQNVSWFTPASRPCHWLLCAGPLPSTTHGSKM